MCWCRGACMYRVEARRRDREEVGCERPQPFDCDTRRVFRTNTLPITQQEWLAAFGFHHDQDGGPVFGGDEEADLAEALQRSMADAAPVCDVGNMDIHMDGWINGWTGGYMDGWVDG